MTRDGIKNPKPLSKDKDIASLNDKKGDIRIPKAMSQDKEKESMDDKKVDIRNPKTMMSEDKEKESLNGKKGDIQNRKAMSQDKEKESVDEKKGDMRIPKAMSQDKEKESMDDKKNDIRNPRTMNKDKEKETLEDKKVDIQNTKVMSKDKEIKETQDEKKDDIRDQKAMGKIKENETLDDEKVNIQNPKAMRKDKEKETEDGKKKIEDDTRKELSAAESDSKWEKLLPSDYKKIISNSKSGSSLINSLSKKDLYFHLCDKGILINNDTMHFRLEKEAGKRRYIVGARELSITWGSSPEYWTWVSLPGSVFPQVAELKSVWWFEIIGRIQTKILSSKTKYAAYLLFKFVQSREGFSTKDVEFDVYFDGSDKRKRRRVLLDPLANKPKQYQDRGNGWNEIEMGEFFFEDGDHRTVVCKLSETDTATVKRGILVQGIEVRPKYG